MSQFFYFASVWPNLLSWSLAWNDEVSLIKMCQNKDCTRLGSRTALGHCRPIYKERTDRAVIRFLTKSKWRIFALDRTQIVPQLTVMITNFLG